MTYNISDIACANMEIPLKSAVSLFLCPSRVDSVITPGRALQSGCALLTLKWRSTNPECNITLERRGSVGQLSRYRSVPPAPRMQQNGHTDTHQASGSGSCHHASSASTSTSSSSPSRRPQAVRRWSGLTSSRTLAQIPPGRSCESGRMIIMR